MFSDNSMKGWAAMPPLLISFQIAACSSTMHPPYFHQAIASVVVGLFQQEILFTYQTAARLNSTSWAQIVFIQPSFNLKSSFTLPSYNIDYKQRQSMLIQNVAIVYMYFN